MPRASPEALQTALARRREEPQLALREGGLRAPRLARCAGPGRAPEPLDPEGTVLITGGTGGPRRPVARHLVDEHGVRHLLLVSRSGPEARRRRRAAGELEALGARSRSPPATSPTATSSRQLLASIPAAHPLAAVFHCAGVLDDGVIGSLDAERLDRVLAPKVDAAWHLHELTRELDLSLSSSSPRSPA